MWDEPKRIANLQKHGLDFADVADFEWETAFIEASHTNRLKAIGYFRDGTAVVIFATLGTEASLIISFVRQDARKRSFRMSTDYRTKAQFEPNRMYTEEDWKAIDSPQLTDQELSNMRPAKEVLPSSFFEGVKAARRGPGRPKSDAPKEPLTLRLDADVIEVFRGRGEDWRAQMSEVLRKAAGL
ncbi:uncharacterized DUF497 family protein [Rhizobium sp. PP-CC-3A-592]|nr:uncharacterized DUF497 family protein [Rhizobium sp. PP-CC-3A-592]